MYTEHSVGLHYTVDSALAPVLPINASSCCDMFHGCITLERLDLSHFRTENVVTMMSMFEACYNLKELDLSNFNTENVINMSKMFEDCTKLTTLSVKGFSTVNGKPLPILKALSIRYPHIRFKCRILTDDGNYDYIFENGEVIKED